jgi:hypothetical protein
MQHTFDVKMSLVRYTIGILVVTRRALADSSVAHLDSSIEQRPMIFYVTTALALIQTSTSAVDRKVCATLTTAPILTSQSGMHLSSTASRGLVKRWTGILAAMLLACATILCAPSVRFRSSTRLRSSATMSRVPIQILILAVFLRVIACLSNVLQIINTDTMLMLCSVRMKIVLIQITTFAVPKRASVTPSNAPQAGTTRKPLTLFIVMASHV